MSIQVIKATDARIKITFTKNGAAFDITDYTLFFTVKKPVGVSEDDDESAVISKDITVHTDPTHGISNIILSNIETDIDVGTYYWDIKLVKDGVVSSTLYDKMEILQNITKRKTIS